MLLLADCIGIIPLNITTTNLTLIDVGPGSSVLLVVDISNTYPNQTQWLINSTAIRNSSFAEIETYQSNTDTTTSILQLYSIYLNNSGIYCITANNSINSSAIQRKYTTGILENLTFKFFIYLYIFHMVYAIYFVMEH